MKWISVKDRLPDASRFGRAEVMVWGSEEEVVWCSELEFIVFGDAYYKEGKFYTFYDECCQYADFKCEGGSCESEKIIIKRPLFWMSLPDPPSDKQFEESYGPWKEFVKKTCS